MRGERRVGVVGGDAVGGPGSGDGIGVARERNTGEGAETAEGDHCVFGDEVVMFVFNTVLGILRLRRC